MLLLNYLLASTLQAPYFPISWAPLLKYGYQKTMTLDADEIQISHLSRRCM